MKTAIYDILDLLKAKKSRENWPTELKFNGQNLLDIAASSANKFSLAVFRKLFTEEERKIGFIEGESKSSTKRTILDQERCLLLKQAVEIKYRVAEVYIFLFFLKL